MYYEIVNFNEMFTLIETILDSRRISTQSQTTGNEFKEVEGYH